VILSRNVEAAFLIVLFKNLELQLYGIFGLVFSMKLNDVICLCRIIIVLAPVPTIIFVVGRVDAPQRVVSLVRWRKLRNSVNFSHRLSRGYSTLLVHVVAKAVHRLRVKLIHARFADS